MRSVYIITGGILVMIAVVFFTHHSKKISAHDAVQQIEADLQEQQNKRG